MGIIKDLSDAVIRLLSLPVDLMVKLDKEISCKGTVFLVMAITVCIMEILRIPITHGFGELFKWYTLIYLGGGTVKLLKDLRK